MPLSINIIDIFQNRHILVVINDDNMEPESALKSLGLDDSEVAVYLACLKLGPARVQDVAKESGVKRTTVYLVAKGLMEKRLLGQYITRRGLHLSAQSPEFLLGQLEEKTKLLASALPALNALNKKDVHKPEILYYEGKQGFFTVCEDTLAKHLSEILWFGNPKELYDVIGDEYDNKYYIPTRLKRRINIRALLVKNKWSEKLAGQDNASLQREIKFLPNDYPINTTQFIYQNKVATTSSTKELISVVIKSDDISATERAKFEWLWKQQ